MAILFEGAKILKRLGFEMNERNQKIWNTCTNEKCINKNWTYLNDTSNQPIINSVIFANYCILKNISIFLLSNN